jgi:hypothetical protein
MNRGLSFDERIASRVTITHQQGHDINYVPVLLTNAFGDQQPLYREPHHQWLLDLGFTPLQNEPATKRIAIVNHTGTSRQTQYAIEIQQLVEIDSSESDDFLNPETDDMDQDVVPNNLAQNEPQQQPAEQTRHSKPATPILLRRDLEPHLDVSLPLTAETNKRQDDHNYKNSRPLPSPKAASSRVPSPDRNVLPLPTELLDVPVCKTDTNQNLVPRSAQFFNVPLVLQHHQISPQNDQLTMTLSATCLGSSVDKAREFCAHIILTDPKRRCTGVVIGSWTTLSDDNAVRRVQPVLVRFPHFPNMSCQDMSMEVHTEAKYNGSVEVIVHITCTFCGDPDSFNAFQLRKWFNASSVGKCIVKCSQATPCAGVD